MTTHPAPRNNRNDDTRVAFATEYVSVGNQAMPVARPLPKRLLGIWAHPDDEAYLSAGLMARVVASGGSVTVLAATRGEKGTDSSRHQQLLFEYLNPVAARVARMAGFDQAVWRPEYGNDGFVERVSC